MDGESLVKFAVVVLVLYVAYRFVGGRIGPGGLVAGPRQTYYDERDLTTPGVYLNWGEWAPAGPGFGGFGFGSIGIPIYGTPNAYGPGYSHPSDYGWSEGGRPGGGGWHGGRG